jgi:hypothetical protein
MSDLDQRLAVARENKREKEYVTKRLAETRADHARVSAQLEVMASLLANEQADVDRLQKGVGGFFRRIAASRDDLTREEKELAAAKLQHQALLDELEAIDADLKQLAQREAAVANADTVYAALIAEKGRTVSSPQLDALADTEARIAGLRKEIAEAIAAGQAAHGALATIQEVAAANNTQAQGARIGLEIFGLAGGGRTGLAAGIGTDDLASAAVRESLRADLGNAQHALVRFQRECRDVTPDAGITGVDLTPLPSLVALVAREVLWTNQTVVADIHAEVTLIGNHVAQTVMELRGRDEQLQRALASVAAERAAMVDPQTTPGRLQ